MMCSGVFSFKCKTAAEVRISGWSSGVCSSDLAEIGNLLGRPHPHAPVELARPRPPGGAADAPGDVRVELGLADACILVVEERRESFADELAVHEGVVVPLPRRVPGGPDWRSGRPDPPGDRKSVV